MSGIIVHRSPMYTCILELNSFGNDLHCILFCKWQDGDLDKDDINTQRADDGKTELSLMHFAITNPKWSPPQDQDRFLKELKVSYLV